MSKAKRQRDPRGSGSKPSDTISDPRFTNIQTDPRFRLPSKRNTHVEIDERFAPMLDDEAFSSKAKIDRYGRKLVQGNGKRELEKFYRMEGKKAEKDEVEDSDDRIDDDAVEKELERLSRQERDALDSEEQSEISGSSSEEDDDDSDLDDADEDDNEVFGQLEDGSESREGIPKGEVSSRLAIVNLDWDNIRATDLMAVFQSFVPTTGRIVSIAIFPSEFGKERMEREELEGPPKEIFAQASRTTAEADKVDGAEEADDDQIKQSLLKADDGAEFSSARLRRYQLSRLRYYYAVVVCSSSSVASAIYDTVDGTEYLTTANFLDLRYIPDETTFDEDTPRDECTKLPDGYRPNEFVTEALQHSKVKLTWDADDGARKEVQKRAFGGSRKDVDENDLRAYLGSDSEEEENGDDDDENDRNGLRDDNDVRKPVLVDISTAESGKDNLVLSEVPSKKISKKEAERQRMRALLGLSTEPSSQKSKADKAAPVGDMQVTFTSGLSTSMDASKKHSIFENEPERVETTVEKYVRKEKERKARRREKSKQKSSVGHAEGDDKGSNDEATAGKELAKQQQEGDGESEEETDLGFNDPFFTTGFEAPPTAKTTSSTRKAERQRKRIEREAAESASALERAQLANLLAPQPPPVPSGQTSDTTVAMNNNNSEDPTEINHFNINALSRADKLTAKPKIKKKKHHLSARDKEALGAKAQDTFQMDVADERFRDLYERAEFAVDPTHPRFQATEGMKQVLEEGRRKKRRKKEAEEQGVYGEGLDRVFDGGERTGIGSGTGKRKKAREAMSDDVEELVKKVKQQSRAVVPRRKS